MSEYNPFGDTDEPAVPIAVTRPIPKPSFVPAVVPTVSSRSKPNENTPILTQNQAENDAQRRQLQEKEDELNRREAELSRNISNQAAGKKDDSGDTINNFPPFPGFFCCKPCFYQDFDVEINSMYRPTVKFGFYIWLFYSLVMFVNVFGTLAYMINSNTNAESASVFGLSIVIFVCLVPLSYLFWFRPLYKCFRSLSSFNYFTFCLFFTVQIILMIIQCLGINWLGSCGWINSLNSMKADYGVAIFMLVICIGFTVNVCFSVFLMLKVNRLYRGSGLSVQKAKEEVIRDAASNIRYT